MITKTECIAILNSMNNEIAISFDRIISFISDYLTEIKYENSDKIINLIVQNPNLAQYAIPKVSDYFIRKYGILSLWFNNKIIMYYE